MLLCPTCTKSYPNGTLVCPQDGYEFVPLKTTSPGVPLRQALIPPVNPTFELILERCGGTEVPMNEQTVWDFPFELAGDPPLRIGRHDRTSSPPIQPEIDLAPALQFMPSPLSRIQACIERYKGKLCVRAVSERVTTWHRRTGEHKARRLALDEYVELSDYDVLYLGEPDGMHVRLRVHLFNIHP